MKVRIIGAIFVLAILGILYILTEGDQIQNQQNAVRPMPAAPTDNQFKDLKIQ